MLRFSLAAYAARARREVQLLCHDLQYLEHNDWYDCGLASMGLPASWTPSEHLYLLFELRSFLLHMQTDRWCDLKRSRFLHHFEALLRYVRILCWYHLSVHHAFGCCNRAIYYPNSAAVSYLHGLVLVDFLEWLRTAHAYCRTCFLFVQHSIHGHVPLLHLSPRLLEEKPRRLHSIGQPRLYLRHNVYHRDHLPGLLLFR